LKNLEGFQNHAEEELDLLEHDAVSIATEISEELGAFNFKSVI
jgi:hypothetical protein